MAFALLLPASPMRARASHLVLAARTPPSRAHPVLAARTPQVSVRCAYSKTGGNFAARDPGDIDCPAVDALGAAAVDAFRPLMDNLDHVLSLKNVLDLNDYNMGMPLGVLMASIGCYQLFKVDPWTCLDVVLGYAFYKLSVISSQVHRRGCANDLITAIKIAIVVIVLIKDLPKNLNLFYTIRLFIFYVYTVTSCFAWKGWKHHFRDNLIFIFKVLQTKAGRRQFARDFFDRTTISCMILLCIFIWL